MTQIPAHTVRRLLHEGEHSLFIIVSNILVVFVLKRRRQISAMLSCESLGGGGIEVVVKRLQVFLHWRKGRQSVLASSMSRYFKTISFQNLK